MSAVAELRRVLEARFPNAIPPPERTVPQIPTGLAELDGILPSGGLPRGRMSIWMPGIGGAAVLRSACRQAVQSGERAAWIDGVGRVGPGMDWGGVVLARPRTEKEGLECTEELLMCGGFGLVVRWGEGSRGAERVRLCKAARESGAALIELSADPHMSALKLQGRLTSGSFRWRCNRMGEPVEVEAVSLRVTVSGGGWLKETDIALKVVDHEAPLFLEPELADRRGVIPR